MSKKRLFIAIGLPESLIIELEHLQEQLKPFTRNAKWVRVSGTHLTLKFLGYVDPENIPAIEKSLADIAKGTASVPIRATGCGFFPNARRPNVLWAGVDSPALLPLQQNVEDSMARLGFEKENRLYTPHLTLARFKNARGPLPSSVQETEKFQSKDLGSFTAQSFSIYESILRREGAEYHILHEFFLQKIAK